MNATSMDARPQVHFKKMVRIAVFLTVMLDAMGIGLVRPVAPALMQQFTPHPISDVPSVLGIWFAMYSIGLFLAAPAIGHLSDNLGRRRVLLLFMLGAAIDYAVAATTTNVWIFFAARFLAGVCAGNGAVAQALVADITRPEDRAKNFALLGTAFGIGMIVGPPVGGVLGQINVAAPFAVASCLAFLVWGLNYFVLPETLPPERRRALDLSGANPVKAIFAMRGMGAGNLIAVVLLLNFASFIADCTTVLFTQAQLQWTTAQVGLFISVSSIASVLLRTPLTSWSVSTLGERRTILVGMLFMTVSQFLFSTAHETWQMFGVILVMVLGSASGPTLFGALSRSVAPAQMGRFMGGMTSLQVLVAGAAAPVGTAIFDFFTSPRAPVRLPGASYVVSSILLGVALLVVLMTKLPPKASAPAPAPAAAGPAREPEGSPKLQEARE